MKLPASLLVLLGAGSALLGVGCSTQASKENGASESARALSSEASEAHPSGRRAEAASTSATSTLASAGRQPSAGTSPDPASTNAATPFLRAVGGPSGPVASPQGSSIGDKPDGGTPPLPKPKPKPNPHPDPCPPCGMG